MFNTRKTAILALAAVMASASAWAQDEPAKEQPQEPEKETAPWTHKDTVIFGYGDWALRGSEHRFLQYGTPPEGFGFTLLDLTLALGQATPFGRFFWGNPFRPDSGAYGLLQFDQGRMSVDVDMARSQFYDPTPGFFDASRDQKLQVTVSRRFSEDLGLWVRYRRDQQDKNYVGPTPAVQTRNRTTMAGLEGRVLDGDASLTYRDSRFVDISGAQPESASRTWNLSYGRQFGETLGLQGSVGKTVIEQDGYKDSEVKTASVGGDLALGPDTVLTADFNRQQIDLPNVANAYDRDRFNTRVGLDHRWQGLNIKLGYRHRESERFRADQSYVDVLKYDRLEARVSTRLPGRMRFSGNWFWEHGGNSAVMQTTDSRELYWNQRARGQAKLEGGFGQTNAYATYTLDYKKNGQRDISVSTGTFALGLSHTFSDTTNGFFEISNEQSKVTGLVDTGIDLDSFFPSTTAVCVGVDWTVTPTTWFDASYTHYVTNNDNPFLDRDGNVRGRFLSATLRHQFSTGNEVSLTFAPWHFEDRVYPNGGFDATAVFLNFHLKF